MCIWILFAFLAVSGFVLGFIVSQFGTSHSGYPYLSSVACSFRDCLFEISHSASLYLFSAIRSASVFMHASYMNSELLFMHSISFLLKLIACLGSSLSFIRSLQLFQYNAFWSVIFVWQLFSLVAFVLKSCKRRSVMRCFMQAARNDHNLQAATGRIPPSWDPREEKKYPFRMWLIDLALWQASTDVDALRQAPMMAMRLHGAAKDLVRELDPGQLVNGRMIADPFNPGQFMPQTGVEYLIRILTARFAPLQQEVQLSAIHDLFSFRKNQADSFDECITRYELMIYRAQIHGQIVVPIVMKSYMLLQALHIGRDKWHILLIPTAGMLPANDDQYRAFMTYIRQTGHMIDGSQQRNIGGNHQHYFGELFPPQDFHHFDQHQTYYDNQHHDSWPAPGAAYGYEQPQQSYAASEFASQSGGAEEEDSSGHSNWESEIPLEDIAHLPPNEAGETLYLAYRGAKRRFRHFSGSGPRRKGGEGRFRKGKGKGRGKNSHGKGFGKPTFYADGTPVAEEYEDEWSASRVF